MTASQQIIGEHGKTDFNAVIDAKKLLSLDRSTSKTEPLAQLRKIFILVGISLPNSSDSTIIFSADSAAPGAKETLPDR